MIIGSGIGGIETLEEQNKVLLSRGVSRVSPFTVPASDGERRQRKCLDHPQDQRPQHRRGSTACATGTNAIGDASRYIQFDMADVMIAGGSEAALCELGMASFIAARALSNRNEEPEKASRPFRQGPRWFCHGRRCRRGESWKSTSTPNAAVQESTPKSSVTA